MLEITEEEIPDIICDCHDDFEQVAREFEGHARWFVDYTYICRHKTTGRLWAFPVREAATEYQETEFPVPEEVFEVREVEKTVKAYKPIK